MFLYPTLFFSAILSFCLARQKEMVIFLLFIFGVAFSIVVGFRSETVGIDTKAYYQIFDTIQTSPDDPYIERKIQLFYRLLNHAADFLGGDASLAMFFAASITIGFVFITIYRYSPSIGLSLAIFLSIELFFFAHNVVRQAIAISIVFASVGFVIHRRLLLFSFSIFFAYLFHSSAIVAFPIYFLARVRFNHWLILLAWLGSLVFIIFKDLIFIIFLAMVSYAPEQYAYFASKQGVYTLGGQGLGLVLIFKQFLFLILYYAYTKLGINDKKEQVFILLSLIGLILNNVFYHIGLVDRLVSFYSVFIIVGIPIAIRFLFRNQSYILSMIFMYSAFIVIFIRALFTSPHGIFPYSFNWGLFL